MKVGQRFTHDGVLYTCVWITDEKVYAERVSDGKFKEFNKQDVEL